MTDLSPEAAKAIAEGVAQALAKVVPAPALAAAAPRIMFADAAPPAAAAVPGIQPAAAWGTPAPAAAPVPVGVAFRVRLPVAGDGTTVSCYLQFGPEYGTPQALQALAYQLHQAGVPLDVWRPKRNGFAGGRGGWS